MSTENQELRKVGLKVTLPRVKILNLLDLLNGKIWDLQFFISTI